MDIPVGAVLPTFDDTIGPFLIGTLLTLFLILFFMNSRQTREPWGYIVLVAGVTVCDVLHSAFAINTIWHWMVENYANPSVLALSPWSFTAEPVMTALLALVVHLFYAHRVWIVSEKSVLGSAIAAVISVLTFIQFGFGAAVTGKIIAYDRQFVRFSEWLWGACTWLGFAACADIVICCGYLHFLGAVSKSMAGPFERSTRSIIAVGILILATNGLSAAAAVIATVLFGVYRQTNYHAIAQLCLLKFLALSLLVALNARTLLSDLLGLDAGYFHSFATQPGSVKRFGRPGTADSASAGAGPGAGAGSGTGAGAAAGAAAAVDGVYGRAAAQAGFDALARGKGSRPGPGSLGGAPAPGSAGELAVHGAGGVIYPLSMPHAADGAARPPQPPSPPRSGERDARVVAFANGPGHSAVGTFSRRVLRSSPPPLPRTGND
ncbi:hypothetical protein JCM3770_000631 [Rhodotorula araucariae]